VRQHNLGDVGEFRIFLCDVSSGFVYHKLLKSVHFSPSYSKYKEAGRFLRRRIIKKERKPKHKTRCTGKSSNQSAESKTGNNKREASRSDRR